MKEVLRRKEVIENYSKPFAAADHVARIMPLQTAGKATTTTNLFPTFLITKNLIQKSKKALRVLAP